MFEDLLESLDLTHEIVNLCSKILALLGLSFSYAIGISIPRSQFFPHTIADLNLAMSVCWSAMSIKVRYHSMKTDIPKGQNASIQIPARLI